MFSSNAEIPGADTEFGLFRILVDEAGNELTVSLQVQDDPNGPSRSDQVYFGMSDETGDNAYGVLIPLHALDPSTGDAPAFGSYLDPDNNSVRGYSFTRATGGWASPATGVPGWVKDVGIWNDPTARAANGAAWVVQLKIDLVAIGLGGGTSPARINMGFNVAEDGPLAAVTAYALPNTVNGCDGPAGRCTLFGPFFHNPAQWTPTSAINAGCADGIVIDKLDLGTGLTQSTDTGPLWVDPVAGRTNTFKVRPQYNGVTAYEGTLNARIRVSNWGTIANPQTDWVELKGRGLDATGKLITSAETPNLADNAEELAYSCTNGSGANNVCEQSLNTSLHQCMHVELSAVSGNQIPFTQATAWRNTRFVKASTVDETAEISVRGLQRILGNTNARDVYLHVVTTNMPPAGTEPIELNVPALEALRDQVDPFFEPPYSSYCSDSKDLCLPTRGGAGRCARPWYSGCDNVISLPDANYLCATNETCTVPAGGGANAWLTSLTRSQVLTANYPTIMIYPYYDSGETYMVDGVERKRLVPMYSFGLHVKHEGEFYGWLHELVGTGLTEIRPDWYKITIPNEGTRQIRVMLSAEEQPHYAPFSSIAGAAATLGANWGSVVLSGVTPSRPVDLRKATIRIDQVLRDKSTELVSGVGTGITLRPAPGALARAATFVSTTNSPKIVMEVIDVPLVGLVTNVQVGNTTVSRPSSCGWFGTAMLSTSFTIDDGTNPALAIRGQDQWSCIPLKMYNY
jgi:hypothetical protein